MTDRTRIRIEDLLRAETGVRDVHRTWRWLVHEVPRRRRAVLRLVGLTLGEVGAQVLVALVGKQILDAATGPNPVVDAGLAAGAFALVVVAFVFVRARQVAQEETALSARARGVERLARNIHRAGYEDLAAVPMAELREIIMTDVSFAYRFFVDSITQGVVITFWLLAAVGLMLWFSWPLLLLMAAIGSVFTVGTMVALRKHMALTGEKFSRLADLSQRARDVVEVERIVLSRQFGIGDFFVRLFMKAHARFVEVMLAQGRLAATIRTSVLILNTVAFLAIVCVGGLLIADGDLTPGGLIAVLFVVGQLLGAVAQMGDHAGRAAETATAGKRLGAYWHDPAAPPTPPTSAPESVRRLRALGLSFRYGGGPFVFEDVDVELERGRLAALTAATGAGKTTLALVLTGLLHPTHGTVRLDGRWRPGDLSPGRILYVGSKPILMEGSVRDNLFLHEAPHEPLRASLQGFLQRLWSDGRPLSVDDPVIGPNGTGVSSGQGQLIQLMRAVLREPDVVVFDEATSALDMDTEAALQEELLPWCRRRICLVISHRRCPWTEQADVHLTL